MEIKLLDLYRDFLLPLTPSPAVSDLLTVIMTGGETTQDFAAAAEKDPEIRQWIEIAARRIVKSRHATSMEYKISVLGQDRVRNMMIGRHIERAVIPEEKSLFSQTAAAADAQAATKKSDSGPSADEEDPTGGKIIPDFSAFEKYVKYAVRGEAAAVELKYSFPGQAFAAGVLFDYVQAFLPRLNIESKVEDVKLKKPEKFVEEIFLDGLRCAIVANEISIFVQIHFQKNIFFSAIVRNIGKSLLLAYDPAGYERSLRAQKEAAKAGIPLRNVEVEEDEFDFDHAQLSALFIGRVPALKGLDQSLDYHHKPRLVKSRNRDQYALSSLLSLAGKLVTGYQDLRQRGESDIQKLPDRRLVESDVFKVLKLTPAEWEKVKGHYAMHLMKLGL